ncbi:carboxypeptidase-like regulatory domain-containing protein [Mucilaginibacter sp. UR6-1]|uniref:TonB-dependent receptor domain-containing protein n=1 Tax=Mucilaginibacter sp. UR6-1 TaxID=1435643 RepID=UPI001E28E212|nr:TonB-dependent receptor [Mucilaginibacter sp. UR6-1]MCC8409467.1 carboxypeptidase-like regulatory domain-containing protein [Mucilaginibacter sp. UR6-1]
MKCSLIVLIVQLTFLSMLYASSAKSQTLDQKIDLNLENASVKESLKKIQQLSKVNFLFDDVLLKSINKKVSIRVNNITVKDALESILDRTVLQYRIINGFVTIDRKPIPPPPGVIEGTIYDAKTNESLIGAIVIVSGRSYPTDVQGHYKININPGTYSVEARFIGYDSKTISSVIVKSATVTTLNIQLQPSSTALGEVKIEARRRAGNEVVLLNDRKNSSAVTDGISAQNIEKTASITTTQALQRVTGVTITDDKYVAIRGLGDRSVIAQLNGARLSSANPERSTVPLDLVPAALLDNINIYKTSSPDRPADASAGLIELKTKSVPEHLVFEVTAQTGYNSNVGLGGQYNSFYNGDPGFFGQNVSKHNLSSDFLNLSRQYPGGLVQIQDLFIQSRNSPALKAEALRVSKVMQSLDPVLTTSYRKADPNQVYTISFGNSYKVLGGHTLGVIVNANYYQRTTDIYNGERNQYSLYQGVVTGSPSIYNPLRIPGTISPNYPRLGKYISYAENTGTKTLNYGGLLGLTYQFNKRNEIQFQYIGSRGAEAEGSNLNGTWQNTGLNYPVYNTVNQLRNTYRKFNTFNFQGEHKILDKEWSPKLSYNLSSSNSSQNDPDFRSTNVANLRTVQYQDPNGVGIGTNTYSFVSGLVHGAGSDLNNVIVADPNGRQYRKLDETNYNLKADVTQPFKTGKLQQAFKFGVNYLKRNRDFTQNILGLPGSTLTGGNAQLLNNVKGDINQLVSPANIGLLAPDRYDNEGQPMAGGFLYQIRKAPNNYTGTYETRAFYSMLDAHVLEALRVTGGVRFESTDIRAQVDTANVFVPLNLNTITGLPTEKVGYNTTMPNTRYSRNYRPYYSVNITYSKIKNMNFRLAYSTSLARPELRELTNIFEFDPFQFAVIGGNPNLINQLTKSADFRWEWFDSPGEILSASVFTKTIENPLQRVFRYASQGNLSTAPEFPLIIYENDPNNGKVYGVEMEARRDLGKIWDPLKYLFVGTNLLFNVSSIQKNPERLDAARINDRRSPETSPVFEQAPYAINTYLDYANTRSGTNITASFNIVGPRLIQVQLDGTPDLYDRPVPTMDLVFSQKLGAKWIIKGFAKNLFDPAYKQVYTSPGQNGKFYGSEYIYRSYHKGAEFSLGLTYKLF